jgi:hypothetical protein
MERNKSWVPQGALAWMAQLSFLLHPQATLGPAYRTSRRRRLRGTLRRRPSPTSCPAADAGGQRPLCTPSCGSDSTILRTRWVLSPSKKEGAPPQQPCQLMYWRPVHITSSVQRVLRGPFIAIRSCAYASGWVQQCASSWLHQCASGWLQQKVIANELERRRKKREGSQLGSRARGTSMGAATGSNGTGARTHQTRCADLPTPLAMDTRHLPDFISDLTLAGGVPKR